MKTLRTFTLAALALAAPSLSPNLAWGQTKVLRHVPQADLKILDPVVNPAFITVQHAYMVYDQLFALDANRRPKPQMAEGWTLSPDNRTYTITLRPGLKFHDGTPVRAADAMASIKRWTVKDPAGSQMPKLGMELKAIDERTFTLTLREPWGMAIDAMAKPSWALFVMRESDALRDVATPVTDVIGSGPFRFVRSEWVPGSRVVYERNPDYVPRAEPAEYYAGGKKVNVDRVEWVIIPDAQTQVSALIRGEVDEVEAPSIDLLPLLEKAPGVKVTIHDRVGNQAMLRMNHLYPPFDNPKARQALLYMVNQEEYLAAAGFSEKYRVKQTAAYFMAGSVNATNAGGEAVLGGQNIAKAKQLLKEAGYKGEKVVVLVPSDPPVQAAAAMVTVQNLKKIGMNVEAQAMDWSTLLGRRAKKESVENGGWSIFHTYSVGFDVMSPVVNSYIGGAGEAGPAGWSNDPKMEALRMAWAKEGNLAKRKAITEQIQKRAYEEVPYVNFGQFYWPMAYRANLKGLINIGIPVMWNVDK